LASLLEWSQNVANNCALCLQTHATRQTREIRSLAWVNNNMRLVTNNDETITSLRWRTVQLRILRKPGSLKQSTTTARTLISSQAVVICLPCKLAKTC